jgi:hypothetical protein
LLLLLFLVVGILFAVLVVVEVLFALRLVVVEVLVVVEILVVVLLEGFLVVLFVVLILFVVVVLVFIAVKPEGAFVRLEVLRKAPRPFSCSRAWGQGSPVHEAISTQPVRLPCDLGIL